MATGFTHTIMQTINTLDIFKGIVDSLNTFGGETWFNKLGGAESLESIWSLLESTPKVDSYLSTSGNSNQIYRLYFEGVKKGGSDPTLENPEGVPGKLTTMRVFWGTPEQIIFKSNSIQPSIQPGTPSIELFSLSETDTNELSMRLSVTNRGFVFGIWSIPSLNKTSGNSLFCIQRPVNPKTGLPKQGVGSKSPIFCLYRGHNTPSTEFLFSTVREQDVNASTLGISTKIDSDKILYRFTTEWGQPNLFDDFSHVIKFPFGFATSRHLYLDEMDLICLVNANSFVSDQELSITMYSETTQRKYTAIFGDLKYGEFALIPGSNPARYNNNPNIIAGGRICILSHGGGIE